MKEQKRKLDSLQIGKDWTLFLDRDGVINKKIEGDYVRSWDQFEFLPGVFEALQNLSKIFGRIIIVTNQRGIGRGLMTEEDLQDIHSKMLKEFSKHNIQIHGIYYCPHDYKKEECNCRKPKIGMALQAKSDFPDIDFKKSFMVGDSKEDMIFGKTLGMITVYLGKEKIEEYLIDFQFKNLWEFCRFIISHDIIRFDNNGRRRTKKS